MEDIFRRFGLTQITVISVYWKNIKKATRIINVHERTVVLIMEGTLYYELVE